MAGVAGVHTPQWNHADGVLTPQAPLGQGPTAPHGIHSGRSGGTWQTCWVEEFLSFGGEIPETVEIVFQRLGD